MGSHPPTSQPPPPAQPASPLPQQQQSSRPTSRRSSHHRHTRFSFKDQYQPPRSPGRVISAGTSPLPSPSPWNNASSCTSLITLRMARAALLRMCQTTDERVVTKSCENLHVL